MDYLSSIVGAFGGDEEEEKEALVPYEGLGAEVCPSCDWPNHPDRAVCRRCKSALKGFGEEAADEEGGELVATPDFYQPLFEACHQVECEQITLEDWERVWRRVVTTMQQIADGVEGQLVQLREPDPHLVESCQRLQANLESALAALSQMGGYLETEDVQVLNTGWMNLIRATGAIHQSAREFAQLHAAALESDEKAEQAAKKKAAEKKARGPET